MHYGTNTLGRSLRAVKGGEGKEQGRVIFALLDYDPCLVKAVRSADLGHVEALAIFPSALVTGHMGTNDGGGTVFFYKIADWGIHSPKARVTATAMAHSILFLKRSQPYSYTPVTEPVAW